MTLKRRAFLQRLAMTLTALGLSESGLALLSDRYQQSLAQPTRRKLALLIGINQYSESVCDCAPIHGATLNGCLTDVELQQELLIHRFGFQPSDILVLTDQAATRQGIEEAFMAHLTEQARPGDVVVFHMSGLGSQVQIGSENRLVSTLVPVDGLLPSAESPVIHDLLEETLQLLLRSLPTEQVTTILDAGFVPMGRTVQGNLRIRSRPNAPSGQISDAELAVQEQLRSQIARTSLPRPADSFPGLLLSATSGNRLAAEGQWNGFSAGLFTYALTQQLWLSTPATTLRVALNQVIGTVKQTAGLEQQPVLSGQKAQRQGIPSDYFSTNLLTSADGVIRTVEEDGKVQLWLGGLPAAVLENSAASLFAPASGAEPNASSLLQLRSREGLIGKARRVPNDLATSLAAGQLVQEIVRILPRNIGLTVALDTSLERIERVDATSAFAPITRVTSVIAGEQPADVLFGRAVPPQTLTASLSPQTLVGTMPKATEAVPDATTPEATPQPGSYGLFSLGRDAIPNTLIAEAEAVKTAVNRMTPQLKTLLAMKLLRLTVNPGSSRLGVRATLEMLAPQERLIMQQETSRAPWQPPTSKVANLLIEEAASTALAIGSHLQYRLLNYSNRPVYFLLLGLDNSGKAFVLQPPNPSAASSALSKTLIAPGDTLIVPQMAAADWLVQGPPGLAETYVVFSGMPFEQTEQTLQTENRSPAEAHRMAPLLNPLDVVQALLQDLHQASSSSLPPSEVPADSYRLDVNAWATLSFAYQVTAP